MKYTQERLDGMSDTSKRLAFFCKSQGYSPSDDKDIARLYQNGKFSLDDYSYVMPIAFEHGISLTEPREAGMFPNWMANKWSPETGKSEVVTLSTNPLIAIVDCFLLMEVET